jgi:hypothetical protein
VTAPDQQQPPAPDWLSTLDEDTRKTVEARGIKAPADAVKQLRDQMAEVTRLQQEAIKPPKDDAPAEEWDKFYARLGRPEKPDGYQLKLPEGMPKDLPYDEQFAGNFKTWGHEVGLTPKQAQALHDKYLTHFSMQMQAEAEAHGQTVAQSAKALEQAWGAKDGDAFKEKLALVNRVVQARGPDFAKALSSGPVMDAQGRVTNPAMVLLLADFGAATAVNDRVITGNPNGSGQGKSMAQTFYPNMFKEGA